MVLILRLKLRLWFGGHPGCHAFFPPKKIIFSQPTYLLISHPPLFPFGVSYIACKKNFPKNFSTKTPPLSFLTSQRLLVKKIFPKNFPL